MQLIEFIFRDIYTFLGTIIILSIIFDGIATIIEKLK